MKKNWKSHVFVIVCFLFLSCCFQCFVFVFVFAFVFVFVFLMFWNFALSIRNFTLRLA